MPAAVTVRTKADNLFPASFVTSCPRNYFLVMSEINNIPRKEVYQNVTLPKWARGIL